MASTSLQPEPIPGLKQAIQEAPSVTIGTMISAITSSLAIMVDSGKETYDLLGHHLLTTGSPMYNQIMMIFITFMPQPLIDVCMKVNGNYKCPEMVCMGEIIHPVVKAMMFKNILSSHYHDQSMKDKSHGTYADKVSPPPSRRVEGRKEQTSSPTEGNNQHYVGKVLPPNQQNTNTLYMSKVPAEARGEPLKLLTVLRFPEDLFVSPQIKVRNGPHDSYFISGPMDDPEWASKVLACKPVSDIRHTDVHLAMAHRARRPPSEDQVRKREEVAQAMRKHFMMKSHQMSTSTTSTRKRTDNPITPGPNINKRVSDRSTPAGFSKTLNMDIDEAEWSGDDSWAAGNTQVEEEEKGNKEKVT